MGYKVSPELEKKCLALADKVAAPPLADGISEEEFQAAVVALAKSRGFLVYHTFDSRKCAAGFPDLCLVRPDRGVLWMELKSESGKTTAAQDVWLETLALAGQSVWLFRPSDFAKIEEVLR